MDSNMGGLRQEKIWSREFGRQYTDRNARTIEDVDRLYIDNYGISRTFLNKEFLDKNISHKSKILEVGCNIGMQLGLLKEINYQNLWGIELQDYAVQIARKNIREANIIKASALDVPFKDNFFDMVFTSGVLIHIPPERIEKALDEIYRCSSSYIWGFEYYTSEGYQMINYRGKDNLLWKTDFCKLFLERFPDLKLVQKKVLKYQDSNNLDNMYLLKKRNKI
ncbi:MAG: methyltransferase domain-containing protein [Candidatus Omnitrophica bacterium]|nr:methyltransferase domain-containing protein [Candidatus Omnitrophota bacterium]